MPAGRRAPVSKRSPEFRSRVRRLISGRAQASVPTDKTYGPLGALRYNKVNGIAACDRANAASLPEHAGSKTGSDEKLHLIAMNRKPAERQTTRCV
jgi:hypothetical protein